MCTKWLWSPEPVQGWEFPEDYPVFYFSQDLVLLKLKSSLKKLGKGRGHRAELLPKLKFRDQSELMMVETKNKGETKGRGVTFNGKQVDRLELLIFGYFLPAKMAFSYVDTNRWVGPVSDRSPEDAASFRILPVSGKGTDNRDSCGWD